MPIFHHSLAEILLFPSKKKKRINLYKKSEKKNCSKRSISIFYHFMTACIPLSFEGGGMKSAQSDDISSHTFRQISRISHFEERWKDNSLNIQKFFLLVPFKEKNPKDTTAERERERSAEEFYWPRPRESLQSSANKNRRVRTAGWNPTPLRFEN